jgi:hypothetical protein
MENEGQRLVPILNAGFPEWFKPGSGRERGVCFQELKTNFKVATELPMRLA